MDLFALAVLHLVHIPVDLPPVVQPGQGIHRYQGLHILDIEIHHHNRAAEAEQRRVQHKGLNQPEDDHRQRIEPDQPVDFPVLPDLCPVRLPHGKDKGGKQIQDRRRHHHRIIPEAQLSLFIHPETGGNHIGQDDRQNRNNHGNQVPQPDLRIVPFRQIQGGRHIPEPVIGHQAEQHIIRKIEEDHRKTGGRNLSADNGRPADVGNEIKNIGDDRPDEPDLLFLAGAVSPVMNQQNSQNRDTDNTRFQIEKEIIAHLAASSYSAFSCSGVTERT